MGFSNFLTSNKHKGFTKLDKIYYNHIGGLLKDFDEQEELRWDTYYLIIDNLTRQGYKSVLSELKYRITDGDNPNEVILDIIHRYSENIDGVVWLLKKRVEEYLEEDFYKKFF
jgi:hypothetical protein